jgi:lipoprotein signal peptidase
MRLDKKFVLMMIVLVILIILDFQSKSWILSRPSVIDWGFLKLSVTYNNGFIMGYFQDLSQRLREVIVVTFGLFMFFYYLLFIVFFPIRSLLTLFGATFFMAGVLGNLIDRLNHQAVVDFITFDAFFNVPFFNLADSFQWLGLFLLGAGILKDFRLYWPQIELRKNFLTNYDFQLRIALLTTSPILLSNILFILFSFYFFRESENDTTLKSYVILASFIALTFISLTFLISVFLANRISGPVQALRRHLRGIVEGQSEELKLRVNDEFKELEEDFNKLVSKIKNKKD